ncbi:MAG: beta-propeller domain-containing protein, partial [Thermoanaerobaculales bacterium]|nr:beta-propeller domain-containing protein [Thermoanaerobaculales bacterium]
DLYAVIRTFVDYPPELWDLSWRDDIGLPDLSWDATEEERERILAEARLILEPMVEEILADHAIEDFLPQVRDQNRDDPNPIPRTLFDCESLYRPASTSDWSVLSVLHFDLDELGPVTATGLIADGWTVYASQKSLYVAQTSDSWSWWWGWAPTEMTTAIHRFELDPSRPGPVRYAASGTVDGWILDQFALSEHDGYLRVATTEFDWWWGTTPDEEQASSVTVLADDGWGKLRMVGHVGGLGPGERIFAVRFMGAKGYVVTFEQIDPLYTLDLSEPTQPKVIGELEVTGFSSYLHPIGDDWLLAVGQEADEEGRVIGLAVSIFDVRDFSDPKLAHRYLIEGEDDTWSWSEALHDHHAFTYHRGVLSIPAYIGGAQERFSGLLVLAVDPEDGIYELGRIDHQDLSGAEDRAWMRRSVYIEDAIYSLSSAGVKVNSLVNPEVELAKVPFRE